MKYLLCVGLITIVAAGLVSAQSTSELSPTRWGVVLDSPEAKNVTVKKDVTYLKDDRSTLGIDIYAPPGMKAGEKRPAVIFLNAIGDNPSGKVKEWGIYSSWPRLIAAHGMIGISMDADASRIQDSLKGIFAFLEREGASYGIDASRLGVYAASANTTQSIVYLMSDGAAKGIRAAALYYGATPSAETRLRKDLPVLFILAEGDAQGGMGQASMGLWQRVAQERAPWTLMFAADLLHAFDAFQDNDSSRRIVIQTIDFWRTHLQPVPQPTWQPSPAREIVATTYGSDFQKTADLLERYIAANPSDAQAYVMRGRALNSLRKYDEASAVYEKAQQLAPDHQAIPAGLGQVRFAQRRYQDAIPLLSKAIENGFRNSLVYGQLAFSQMSLNRNEEAIRTYEKAFEAGIPPGANTRGVAYYNMACAYARLKNLDKSFEMLGKAVDEGFANRNTFASDTDLEVLRSDPRFAKLLDRLPAGGS
ncbi:MAG: tetratricopeptide repeat protein [Pyrinomonadaceae bacterium]